jgi:hypothetical protein
VATVPHAAGETNRYDDNVKYWANDLGARSGRFLLDLVEHKLALIVRVARDVWGEA